MVMPLREGPHAQDALQPGEAFVTRFSGATNEGGRAVIDTGGTVGIIIDLRRPGTPPLGAHWSNEPQRSAVSAGQVGQVFGIALDNATPPPNIYLTATSAFGLHRNADNTHWMAGMWGPEGGPGTVWKLSAANDLKPEIFAQISLDGRPNTGAALGNIAFDGINKQLYVSDLETGMIHRLRLSDGADLGHYDHGVSGRANFLDATTGAAAALDPVAFDPAGSARIGDCPSGDFARTPSCWNFADFRRRVWGVGVRRDPASGDVRLFYSVWGSQGFGNASYAASGDDQRNSIWSVRIGPDGDFDATSARREFFLPDFFRSPEDIARAGRSHPVTDITFPSIGEQPVMVLAERGGVRNLGLDAENAFATPHEARVLGYELHDGVWQPVGRYDIGFYDRKDEGPPYLRAGSSGGAAFGMGYTGSWEVDPAKPDAFLWMTGDALCSPHGPCLDPAAGTHSDATEVHGLMGREQSAFEELLPDAAVQPYPAPGPAYPATGPDQSFMIDIDVNGEATSDDATRIGDVAIYEAVAKTKPDLKIAKRAQTERCIADGECTFEVIIENVSEVPYEGPLVVRDVAEGGATLLSHAPPDWTCSEIFAGTYDCSHAALSLAPGESVSLALTFKLPAWWSQSVYSNCAELTTPDFTADARSYNNKACDYVPTIEPGAPAYGPNLLVEKFGLDGQCDWFGNCYYVVRVTNAGSAPYTGPLHLHERVDQPGSALVDWAPKPEWTCGPVGAIEFDCTHPPVTLTPGDFLEVILVIQGPPLASGHTHVRNCAWIDWDGAPPDYNPGNEYDCATISRFPPGHPEALPELAILKVAAVTCNRAGAGNPWFCGYGVQIRNIGGAPFEGPILITDTIIAHPATLSAIVPAALWVCVPGIGAAGPYTCTFPPAPGGLPSGGGITLQIGFELPAATPVPSWEQNCAKISTDVDGDGVPEERQSCALSLICDVATANCPKDLSVTKLAESTACLPGDVCWFNVFVHNVSDTPVPGPIEITDVPDPGLGAPVASAPGQTCVPAGGGFTCSDPAGIPPGGNLLFSIGFPVPADFPVTAFENCAELAPSLANVFPFNDKSCAVADIAGADLAPFGGTTCKRGESCTLDVRIDNKGKLPFLGSAGLHGILSPAVTIASITSATSGFTCNATGSGAYECQGAQLDIKPGGAVQLQLIIDIPADFAADKITHVKEMAWPDRKVKDRNPANDRNESIITIEGPKVTPTPPPSCAAGWSDVDRDKAKALSAQGWEITEVTSGGQTILCAKAPPPPQCIGGGVVRGQCECPKGTERKQTGPNAFRCVETALPPQCDSGWIEVSRDRAKALRAQGWDIDEVTSGGKSILCAKEPSLTCSGGSVRNGECICPTGTERKQTGTNAYRCVETAPPPQCDRGWLEVDRDRAKALRAQGWDIKEVTSGGKSILCAKAPPPPQCVGGEVVRAQCECPQGTARKQTGPNAFRCVETAPPPQCDKGWLEVSRDRAKVLRAQGWEIKEATSGGKSILCAKEPSITCSGGSVRNGQCICPTGTERKQTGTNAYRCVETTPPPRCDKGWLEVSRDRAKVLRTQGWDIKEVTSGGKSILCAKEPSLTCSGGSVRNGQCVCPSGTERKQIATNAFRCVTNESPSTSPSITCSGGSVKDGQCICPKGTERKQIATNAFRCVTAESPSTSPALTCSGGSVKDGQCICPKGTIRQPVGRNSFRCRGLPTFR
jgi:hypothetical protein